MPPSRRQARCRAPRSSAPRSVGQPASPSRRGRRARRASRRRPPASASSACSMSGSPSPARSEDHRRAARLGGIGSAIVRERRPRRPRPWQPARRAPRRPARRVAAPMTRTRHAASRARSTTQPIRARSSSGGSVFGIAQTVVKPPRAAARAPDSIVSAAVVARLAQVGVQVAEAGAATRPRGVDPLARRRAAAPDPMRPSTIARSRTVSVPVIRIDDVGRRPGEGWPAHRSRRPKAEGHAAPAAGPAPPSGPGRRSRPGARSGCAGRSRAPR